MSDVETRPAGDGGARVDTGVGAGGRNSSDYGASSIVVVSGLESIRRNPSMYIGSTDEQGLHHLVYELLENALDEAAAGCCTEIALVLHADGSCSVADDGRGIPVELHPEVGVPACEVVLTTLHAGAKFDRRTYATSAGLHGVGLSCVNALSSQLSLDVWRGGRHYRQTYARGVPTTGVAEIGAADRHGSCIHFTPDPAIFDDAPFRRDLLVRRVEELAFLQPAASLRVVDERDGFYEVFAPGAGAAGFLAFRNRDVGVVHPSPVVVCLESEDGSLDVAFQWTERYTEDISSFVNGVRTEDGGPHVDGLRAALASAINTYAEAHSLLDVHDQVSTTDVLEGLTAVLAIRLAEPKFDSQTKRRLSNNEAELFVFDAVAPSFLAQLESDLSLGERVVTRARDATRARRAARLATRTARFQKRAYAVDYEPYKRQFGIRSKDWHDSCSWLTDDGLLQAHVDMWDGPTDGGKLLDVCCGSGVVGGSFANVVASTTGLDITPEMVNLASTRLDQVHQGTVYEIPFETGSFDTVVTREVLHLLPSPERPVSEIFRVLRPGGQFIVGHIVPYGDEDAYWMYRIFKKKQPLLHNMFREPDFRALLLGAGFVDLNMTEYFLWESIDRWIDTHETTPANRQEVLRLFYNAPKQVRDVHPFEVGADGSVRDRWRWCVYSLRKPAP